MQTDATSLANNSQLCWMLHVASICKPCCMLLDVVACCCAKFETAILTYHILFLKCRKYLFPSNLLRKIIFFLHVITSNVTLICYRIDLKCYNFSEEFCDKNNNNNNNNLLLIRHKYLYEYIQMRLTSYIKIIIK